MEFRRRNPAGRTFAGGPFKIVRPSGRKVSRDGLDFYADGQDYDVRTEGDEIWLMEGERLVGYASGETSDWSLLIDEKPCSINQPKIGNNLSALTVGDDQVGTIEGAGFPVRSATIETSLDLSQEQQAFVVMVALLGWRESDRALLGNAPTDAG